MRHGGLEPQLHPSKQPYFQGFADLVDKFVDKIKGRTPKDAPSNPMIPYTYFVAS